MRASEILNEGNDKSPSDVKKNHPDIYKFIQSILGPYSVRDANVHAFDLGQSHHVVFEVQLSAGLGNTIAVMKGKNIDYDIYTSQYKGDSRDGTVFGEYGDFGFEIRHSGKGSKTQTWTFKLPIKSIEEDASDNHSVWDVGIRHNFWTRSGYERMYKPIRVIAADADAAYEIVVNHLDDVIKHFQKSTIRSGDTTYPYLRKDDPYRFSIKDVSSANPAKFKAGKAMNSKGEMVSVTINTDKPIQEAEPKPKPRKHRDSNPFGPMHYDDEPKFGSTRRNKVRDVDDGSRGLSNRERNR